MPLTCTKIQNAIFKQKYLCSKNVCCFQLAQIYVVSVKREIYIFKKSSQISFIILPTDPKKIPSVIFVELFPHFLWPVYHVFSTASTLMTIIISIDRLAILQFQFFMCTKPGLCLLIFSLFQISNTIFTTSCPSSLLCWVSNS